MEQLLKYLENEFAFYSNLIEQVQNQLRTIEENELRLNDNVLIDSYDEFSELVEDYEIRQGQVQEQIDELMNKIGEAY
jgi:chaperonin cofactor prefoldin